MAPTGVPHWAPLAAAAAAAAAAAGSACLCPVGSAVKEPEPEPAPEPEPEPQPEPEPGAAAAGAVAGAEAGCELDGGGTPPLEREVTTYRTRAGASVSVEGFRWVSDAAGGNLAAHGKHTGEAFWHVSRMLADYLCWDCPALQPHAPQAQRVIDLGCGLGLVGLVAGTLVGASGRVDLTDGSEAVVARARDSAAANAAVITCTVASRVLWWGDAAAMAALGSYDLVLASDCIYENGAPEVAAGMARALAKTASALLHPEPAESLPLRGQTPAADWHRWTDMTDPSEWSGLDDFVWPPAEPAALAAERRARGSAAIRPMCVVGFGRRNVSLAVLLDAFEAEGFEHHVPSGERPTQKIPTPDLPLTAPRAQTDSGQPGQRRRAGRRLLGRHFPEPHRAADCDVGVDAALLHALPGGRVGGVALPGRLAKGWLLRARLRQTARAQPGPGSDAGIFELKQRPRAAAACSPGTLAASAVAYQYTLSVPKWSVFVGEQYRRKRSLA